MKYLIMTLLTLSACSSAPCRGVIGAEYDSGTKVVDFVYRGSPADLAGIESGDTLEQIFSDAIPGHHAKVYYSRNGHTLYAEVSLVCVDEFRSW